MGLTIDLRAIRMLEGKPVVRFQAEIANLDNSALRPPEHRVDYQPSVDFIILIDGELRYERRSLTRADGRLMVDLPVGINDRFLTLVSTDAGNSFSFDHLVLIDPELLVEAPK